MYCCYHCYVVMLFLHCCFIVNGSAIGNLLFFHKFEPVFHPIIICVTNEVCTGKSRLVLCNTRHSFASTTILILMLLPVNTFCFLFPLWAKVIILITLALLQHNWISFKVSLSWAGCHDFSQRGWFLLWHSIRFICHVAPPTPHPLFFMLHPLCFSVFPIGLQRYEDAAQALMEVLKVDRTSTEAIQELKRVQISQLMVRIGLCTPPCMQWDEWGLFSLELCLMWFQECGFTREQSSKALIFHGSVEKSLEALSSSDGQPGDCPLLTSRPLASDTVSVFFF